MNTVPNLSLVGLTGSQHLPHPVQAAGPVTKAVSTACRELADSLIEVYGVTSQEAIELASAYLGESA